MIFRGLKPAISVIAPLREALVAERLYDGRRGFQPTLQTRESPASRSDA